MQLEDNTLETETEEATTTVETPAKSQIETLADMFSDKPANEADGGETPPNKGKTAEKHQKVVPPKGLKELAERLTLKPEDLYAIEIPMADGKSMSLGKLKDLGSKEGDLSVRELAIEETRTKKEAEILQSQEELNQLISALPRDTLKPEVINAIRRKQEVYLSQERRKTLEFIPEWNDESKRTEELTGIVEHLKGYGFPQQFLQTIHDARALKYIRENFLREQRLRKALEQVKPAKPATTSKSKPNGAPKKPQVGSKKTFDDKNSRLSKLFE